MRIRSEILGQAATEYLLILVVAVVMVAAVVYFLTSTGPSAISITGSAKTSGDNVVFTPSTAMTPASIPAAEWEYAVYRGSTIIKDWDNGQVALARGAPISLLAIGNQSGDVLKIRYKGTVYDTLIS